MKEPQPDGAATASSPSASGVAGGVEAIFLSSADAEEGAGGESASITQELWRQKHAQQEEAAVGKKKKKVPKKDKQKSGDAKSDQQTTKDAGDSKQVHVSNKHGAGQRTPVASESTSPGKRSKRQQQQGRGEVSGEDGSSHPNVNGRTSLRKTRSVTDVDGERESQDSSAASSAAGRRGGRRMSISVANPYHQYSMGSSSRDSSRRSSAASIVISVSRPDSPLPHLIQRIGEETLSIEFLRIRKTATTIHSASKFRHPRIIIQPPDGSTIHANMTSEETAANLIRMHKDRRNSMPSIPRLELKEENEKDERKQQRKHSKDGRAANKRLSDGGQTRRSRRRRSSTGSSIQGFYMPASRPSSAMAGEAGATTTDPNSRPSSAATIVQLGKLSRPWTPARSPSPGSTGSGNNRQGAGSRNFFRSRTPTSMVAPLQALNNKVNNILGCASNILDFYHTRPDIKKEPDHGRQHRLLKSTKMNEANDSSKSERDETAQSRLIKFRKKAGQGNQTDKLKEFKGKLIKPAKSPQPVVPAAETVKKSVQPVKEKEKPKQQTGKGSQKEKTGSKMWPEKQPAKTSDKSDKKPEQSVKTDKSDKDGSKTTSTKLPKLAKETAVANAFGNMLTKKEQKTTFGNLSIPAGGSALSVSSAVSSQSSGTNSGQDRGKGIPLLKSMMSKSKTKTAVAVVAAAAFTPSGVKSPSLTKNRINKVLKMAKTAGLVARRKPINNSSSHNQSTQNNQSNNQGPPTLVNFFKRSNRTTNADSRIPIKYETFTDKDRAAAVLLGDADIKTTLEKQLKSERGRYVLPKESPAQVYLAQADFEMRIGGLATAKNLLNKALELQPGDKNALCARSRCRLQMGDTKGALDDAEEALNNDSTYVRATYQKGEVLYQMGRFEEALVFYHMGCKQRPDMDLFHQGVRKAQEAIEISLGVKQPTLQQQQQYRTTTIASKKTTSWGKGSSSSRLPPLNGNPNQPLNQFSQQLQQRLWPGGPTSHRESSLLGDLHVDKIYLERLLENPGLHNQSVSSQKIIHHAKETLEYLKGRENFWKQQQPSHIVYTKERTRTKTHRRRIPSSRTNLTSTEDSGTDRDNQQSEEANSSGSGSGSGTGSGSGSGSGSGCNSSRVDDSLSSSEALTEREENETVIARCSSEEVSRILASAVEEDENERDGDRSGVDDEDVAEWRQVIQDMTESIEKEQLDRCTHVFLAKCCGWAVEDEELTGEIEAKMSLMRLHEEQQNQCGDEGNTNEKMHLAIEIAVLYLANGQQELSKSSAQQGLALAELTGDVGALLQLWLLLTAVEASTGNSIGVQTCLANARRIFHGENLSSNQTQLAEDEPANPGEVVNLEQEDEEEDEEDDEEEKEKEEEGLLLD